MILPRNGSWPLQAAHRTSASCLLSRWVGGGSRVRGPWVAGAVTHVSKLGLGSQQGRLPALWAVLCLWPRLSWGPPHGRCCACPHAGWVPAGCCLQVEDQVTVGVIRPLQNQGVLNRAKDIEIGYIIPVIHFRWSLWGADFMKFLGPLLRPAVTQLLGRRGWHVSSPL